MVKENRRCQRGKVWHALNEAEEFRFPTCPESKSECGKHSSGSRLAGS